jgi:CHASE1-domain containing sensor protein
MRPPLFLFLKANIWNVSLIVLGFVIAGIELGTINQSEGSFVKLLFKSNADSAFSAIEKQFTSSQVYQEMMLNYFLTTNGTIDRWSFSNFSSPEILWKVPTMLAIQFSQVVKHPDRAAFETAASASLAFNYSIGQRAGGIGGWTSPQREQYIPILYSEPYSTSRSIFGLDVLFQSPALLRKINETGLSLASDRLRLAQTGNFGLIKYMPLFRNPITGNLGIVRSDSLFGIVGGSYDVHLALTAALQDLELDQIEVFFFNHQPSLMAIHAGTRNNLRYNMTQFESMTIADAQRRSTVFDTYHLNVSSSQQCTVIISARDEFVKARMTFTPYINFILSLVVSVLDMMQMAYGYFNYDKVLKQVTEVHHKASISKKTVEAKTASSKKVIEVQN